MKKFPNVIHVTREGSGTDEYLNVHKDGTESLNDDGQEVAHYELVRVAIVKISRTLVDKKGR